MSQPINARVKTILNDYFMPLPTTAAPADGAKFPGQMLWEFTNNGKVVFKADDKVYNPNDQTSYRKKECEMTIYDRNMIFDYLLDAANNPNFDNVKYIIKRRGFIRQGNQSKLSDQPMSQGEFTIIRDNEGVISLGYTRGDYKILFKFSAPGFNETLFKEGGEWKPNPGRASQAWVRSYVTACRRLIDLKEFEIYQPPKPRNNNNNGGNNNNNNGNYNNNNQSNNNFDDIDDIDF